MLGYVFLNQCLHHYLWMHRIIRRSSYWMKTDTWFLMHLVWRKWKTREGFAWRPRSHTSSCRHTGNFWSPQKGGWRGHAHLLQNHTACPCGWRYPKHLDPCPPPRGALCDCHGTVTHKLGLFFIYDLWKPEERKHIKMQCPLRLERVNSGDSELTRFYF